MQNFQIPFWMRSGLHRIRLPLPMKTNMLPDVVEYLYYQHEGWLPLVLGMMGVQFMVLCSLLRAFYGRCRENFCHD